MMYHDDKDCYLKPLSCHKATTQHGLCDDGFISTARVGVEPAPS